MNGNASRGGKRRHGRILRAVELVKTAIIAVLTVALLANAAGYITLIQNVATGGLEEIPWEKLRVFQNGGIIPETGSVNVLHISPAYIAMSDGGDAVCSIYDKAMTDMLFEGFRPYLAAALNGTAGEGSEELWNKCIDSPDFVYMKLAGELPAAALRVFLSAGDGGGDEESTSGEGASEENAALTAFASELFLIPTDRVGKEDALPGRADTPPGRADTPPGWYAVLRDNTGNVTILTPAAQNAAFFNTDAIKAYTDITDKARTVSFSFLGGRSINELGGIYSNNISKITLPGTFPVLDSFTGAPGVRFVSAVGFEPGSGGLDRTRRLLQVLGYNPEKAKYYSLASGSRTYIGSQGSLRIQPDGAVLFTGEEGIHLSRYLGYDSTSYSFKDIISCADILMDSLAAAVDASAADSGGMSVKLCGVSVGADSKDPDGPSLVTVSFSFYSDGYKLLWGEASEEAMASVTIKNDAVIGLTMRAGTAEKGANARNLSPIYTLSRLEQDGITELSGLELCYRLDGTDTFVLPAWTARVRSVALPVSGSTEVEQ